MTGSCDPALLWLALGVVQFIGLGAGSSWDSARSGRPRSSTGSARPSAPDSTVGGPGRACVVSTTQIYTHVLNRGPAGVRSPAALFRSPGR
jgi:hypothetical protein